MANIKGRAFVSCGLTGRLGFPGIVSGKEPIASAEMSRDMGWIPVLGRSLEEGIATFHSGILARELLWTEGAPRLQSIGMQRQTREVAEHTHQGFPAISSFTQPIWKSMSGIPEVQWKDSMLNVTWVKSLSGK